MPNMIARVLAAMVLLSSVRVASAHCWHDTAYSPGVNFVSAQAACNDYVKKKYPNDVGATGFIDAVVGDPYTFGCSEYYQGNYIYIGVVTATPAADHCYEMMTGPYSTTNIGGAKVQPGFEYTSTQKSKIHDKNYAKCQGHFGSDFYTPVIQEILYGWLGEGEPCRELWVGTNPNNLPARCQGQVHHLIPRDANGCGCGENSAGNAMLVSADVNVRMGNKPPPEALVDYVNNMTKARCVAALPQTIH